VPRTIASGSSAGRPGKGAEFLDTRSKHPRLVRRADVVREEDGPAEVARPHRRRVVRIEVAPDAPGDQHPDLRGHLRCGHGGEGRETCIHRCAAPKIRTGRPLLRSFSFLVGVMLLRYDTAITKQEPQTATGGSAPGVDLGEDAPPELAERDMAAPILEACSLEVLHAV